MDVHASGYDAGTEGELDYRGLKLEGGVEKKCKWMWR